MQGARLFGVALVGATAYIWGMNVLDLPTVLAFLVLGGAALGLVIGRWWIVFVSLGTWTFPIFDPSHADALQPYVGVVYMPLAAVSIAAGVLVRKLSSSRTENRPRAL